MKGVRYLSHHDLILAMDQAKVNLSELPRGARLKGMTRALTDGERLALSYLTAGLFTVGSLGIDTSGVLCRVDTPDSDPQED